MERKLSGSGKSAAQWARKRTGVKAQIHPECLVLHRQEFKVETEILFQLALDKLSDEFRALPIRKNHREFMVLEIEARGGEFGLGFDRIKGQASFSRIA